MIQRRSEKWRGGIGSSSERFVTGKAGFFRLKAMLPCWRRCTQWTKLLFFQKVFFHRTTGLCGWKVELWTMCIVLDKPSSVATTTYISSGGNWDSDAWLQSKKAQPFWPVITRVCWLEKQLLLPFQIWLWGKVVATQPIVSFSWK